MSVPTQVLQTLLESRQKHSDEIYKYLHGDGTQRPWMVPPGWEGDIWNIAGMAGAFDRSPANEVYQDALTGDGRMGTAMAAKQEIEHLACLERAFRVRQMTVARAAAHAMARRRGHGAPAGVHIGVVLQHIQDLKKSGDQRAEEA